MPNALASLDSPTREITPRSSQAPLTGLDRMAVAGLATGDAEQLGALYEFLDNVRDELDADPFHGRLQILSRLIAILTIKVELLEAVSDKLLSKRDFQGAAAARKQLESTTRRLVSLLAEHRLATSAGRRSVEVSVVGQAQVNVGAR